MIGTVLLSGVLLFVSAAVACLPFVAVPIWRALTEEPRVDVESEVEDGEYKSIVRGMSR